jgi:hypothetical protein
MSLECDAHHQLLERHLRIRLDHLDDLLGHLLIDGVLRLGVGLGLTNERSESGTWSGDVFNTCSLGPDTVTVSTESPLLLVGVDKTQ